jgi:hypothetical protein
MGTLFHVCGERLSSSLVDSKLDDFDFERLHVQQKQFASVLKARHRYDPAALAVGSFNDG